MAQLAVRKITKKIGTTQILKDVSLELEDGEFLSLVGPSGSGKSTLLRIIAGLESQDSGEVLIGNKNVDAHAPKERDIAMVFQSYALYPHMSVAQNMALPLRMRSLNSWQRLPFFGSLFPEARTKMSEIEADVKTMAETLDIARLLNRKPGQLSGGQRQRVALGRAMVRRPHVFLMDEPLSNLDTKLRLRMRVEIKELHRRFRTSTVYVTHDPIEALTMSDRIAVMSEGQILQISAPQEIYSNPATVQVAELVGAPKINILSGRVGTKGEVEVAGATLPISTNLSSGTRLIVGVRPEGFSIAHQSAPDSIAAQVQAIEHHGADVFIHLRLNSGGENVIVRIAPHQSAKHRPGEAVSVTPLQQNILLFHPDGSRLDHRQKGSASWFLSDVAMMQSVAVESGRETARCRVE